MLPRSSSAGAADDSPRRHAWDALPLALLALAQLLFNPQWLFDRPFRDPWLYYGYFRFARIYVHEASASTYYASRLSVILPGYLLRHLLPVIAANTVLHLGLYGCALGAFYVSTRAFVGRRAALLTALALGCQGFFLGALGSNYVNGFGIAYYLLATAAVATAAGGERRPGGEPRPAAWLLLAAAGALAVAIVSANLFYAIYLPFLAASFVVLNRRGARLGLVPAATAAAVGVVAALAGLQLLWLFWGGGHGFFLAPTVTWLRDFTRRPSLFKAPFAAWVRGAVWLLAPALILTGSLALCCRRLLAASRIWPAKNRPGRRAVASPPTGPDLLAGPRLPGVRRWDLYVQVHYLAFCALMVLCELGPQGVTLQYPFYASLALPAAFLALAGLLAPLLEELSRRVFVWLLAGTVATLGWLGAGGPLPSWLGWQTLSAYAFTALALAGIAVAVLVTAMTRPRPVSTVSDRPAREPQRRLLRQALLLLVLCLGAPELLGASRRPGRLAPGFVDPRGFSLQLDRTLSVLREADPSLQVRLWYDQSEAAGPLYDSVACSWRLCGRLVNATFPAAGKGRCCDGLPIVPGMQLAVLSQRPPAAATAAALAALATLGLSAHPQGAIAVPGLLPEVRVILLKVTAASWSPR
jgi:hypothetical protein